MHLCSAPYAPQSVLSSKCSLFDTVSSPPENHCLKEGEQQQDRAFLRIQLLHYLGCYKHCISPTEFSGSIGIYDDRVKHWFQCIDLLYDLGFCSTAVGKFICLHFEKLVKYYSVQTRTEQIPFTAPVDPIHFKSTPLLFVLLPDSKDEL